MKKPRLFICGDSWVNYGYPKTELHWTGYLESHYDVYRLGQSDMDNISITYQIGQIPHYKNGDRIIVVFTDPARIFRKYLIKNPYKDENWYNIERIQDTDDLFQKIKLNSNELWYMNMRNDEISFYRKLKKLLYEYKPIFTTWNSAFNDMTADFVNLIEVSSITDEKIENGKIDDHPGIVGNYDFYKIIMNLLNDGFLIEKFRGSDYSKV